MPAPDEYAIPHFSNIGAFHITDDTMKYSDNLFESLLCPWMAIPSVADKKVFPCPIPILSQDLDDIRKIIAKYYLGREEFFDHAIEFQEGIARHKIEYHRSFWGILERNFPLTYRIANPVRNAIKRKKAYICQILKDKYPNLYGKLRAFKHRNDKH